MQLDKLAGNRETEAGAALGPCARPVELPELLEHSLLVVRRDPRAGVRDRDVERAVRRGHVDGDLATFGELDRIADQVEQHLGDLPIVAMADGQPVLQGDL